MPVGPYEERDGDDLLAFRCAGVALGCGAAAASAAAVGCQNEVLAVFTPDMPWLFLAPALLIVLVGSIGLCASRHPASRLFRLQLAVFLLVFAAVLAASGVYAFFSATAAADWIVAGCDDFVAEGLWGDAGRLEAKMRLAQEQYQELASGMAACRAVNPLVYDIAECGLRAECADGREASQQPLFPFFQHVQLSYACGGFCTEAVPLFGLVHMAETLTKKEACAGSMANAVESLGHLYGALSVLVALAVSGVALVLFQAAARMLEDDFDFEEVAGSDLDDDGAKVDEGGGYAYSPVASSGP